MTTAAMPNKLFPDFMPPIHQTAPVFPQYTHTHTHSSVQRAGSVLTDSHHVVPAIQETHAELTVVGRVAHIDERQLPVRVLTDSRCPGHQEPADDEEDDGQ